MSVPCFFGSGLSRKPSDDGLRFSIQHCFHGELDFLETREFIKPTAPPSDLSRSLRAAQHQDAEYRYFLLRQIEFFAEPLLVFDDPASNAANHPDELSLSQFFERLRNRTLIIGHHRLSI